MSKLKQFVKKYIPIYGIASILLALVSLAFYLAMRSSSDFSESIATGFSSYVRIVLSYSFGFLPFSFAELLLILSPLALTVVIILAVRAVKSSLASAVRLALVILGTLLLFFSVYVFTLAPGYTRHTMASNMEIQAVNPTAEELYGTMKIIENEMEALLPEITFGEDGSSVSPHTVAKLSEFICDGYEKVCTQYEGLGIINFDQQAKPVLMSQGMTYLGILGMYSYFTGESNVNIHHPDYSLPHCIAHEFAHSRGISRENEANFIAFLVCINSDDPYVKYSGYMNMYEYLASALGKTDKELLKQAYAEADSKIISEMAAYADFYYANQIELLNKISELVNDNYLKSQGTEGVISYGLVVRLCVGYYKAQ